MNDVAVRTPMQYLDKATGVLRDLGLMPAKLEPAPINALLEKISDLEPDKVQVIARTLGQASVFNEIVREQIAGMEIGERYKTITAGFDSIRDDAKRMVDQLADSKLDLLERATNVWMKISRGDIADRFDKMRDDLSRRHQGHQGPDRARARDPRGLSRLPRRAEAGRGAGARSAEDRDRRSSRRREPRSRPRPRRSRSFAGTEPADRARLELERDEHAAAHAGRGEALSDRQGPLRQSDDLATTRPRS